MIAPEIENRIQKRLDRLYGADKSESIAANIFDYIEQHRSKRTRSVVGPLWTHRDIVLITYGDTIQSPSFPALQTLRSFLTHHLPTEFSMLHILPFFPWSSDDGFSITDFRSVDTGLGDWEDIKALEENFDLVIDLVLNHCSRENLWFNDYLSGDPKASKFFIEVEENTNISSVTRPRSSPLLTGVRTREGMKYVWATFSNDQIDLNYQNPEVLIEFIDILLFYFRQGARMVRLDAVAYLWKKLGTTCIHLPQTHEVVKLFRDILEELEPGALIMTETNVPHAENITYFGDGDEAHVIYQFSLPPLLLHAIFSGSTEYLYQWAKDLEELQVPSGCTFLNFTASHDGVGLRPLEGLVPPEKINVMLDTMRDRGGYISTKSNLDGTESPYELNISFFDAFRDVRAEKNTWHIPTFFLSQIFSLSFKGIPAVYILNLFATPNDSIGVERTGATRAINRRKWDRGELEDLINNRESETGHVFLRYKQLLTIRKSQIAFHPDAAQHILDLNEGLMGLVRTSVDRSQKIITLYNFTDEKQFIGWDQVSYGIMEWTELLKFCIPNFEEKGLYLPPYAACWFTNKTD